MNHFQNGQMKAEKEISSRMVNAKVLNGHEALIKRLEEKGFYGLIDKLKRGEITEDQANRSLNGDKTAVPLVPSKRPAGPLIFGKTPEEIARMQKSGPLK